jgi:DNA-directed RNA polymerase specialized sigma24 family protein
MKTPEEPFWIPEKDPHGRPVDPEVKGNAQLVWKRALLHVDRRTHDTSRVAEIMECTVFSVSRRTHQQADPIKNLQAYIFRSFLRHFGRFLRRQNRFVSLDSLADSQLTVDWLTPFEDELEVQMFLDRMELKYRRIFLLRSAGYSWKEISVELRISVHSAEEGLSHRIRKQIAAIRKARSKYS